jgi:hypothetical protein
VGVQEGQLREIEDDRESGGVAARIERLDSRTSVEVTAHPYQTVGAAHRKLRVHVLLPD